MELTTYIILTLQNNQIPVVYINDVEIQHKDKVMCFVMYLNNRLTWKYHFKKK